MPVIVNDHTIILQILQLLTHHPKKLINLKIMAFLEKIELFITPQHIRKPQIVKSLEVINLGRWEENERVELSEENRSLKFTNDRRQICIQECPKDLKRAFKALI